MTEIPIQQKSGIAWCIWALLALIVIGLLFWLFSGNDEVETAAMAPATTMVAEQPANGPITDFTALIATNDMTTLVGRQVRLDDVMVQQLVGDRSFWIGPDNVHRMFVVLDEQPTPNQPGVEGRYDVTVGQIIDVTGQVMRVNDPAFGGQPIAGLPLGQQAVIRAQSLNIVERP